MSNLTFSATSLNDARRIILRNIIKEKYPNAELSEYFIKSEIEYIEGQIEDILTMKAFPQGELTDAESVNKEMEAFDIDIRTVFKRLGYTNLQISTQRKITESLLNEIRNRINEANRKISEANELQRKSNSSSILFDDFTDYRNQELSQQFDTERSGRNMAIGERLVVEPVDDTLRLPLINKEDQLNNFNGMRMVEIEIGKQAGGDLIKHRNPANSLEKAIDTSMESYWSEVILVDEPFTINFGKEYYDTVFGATVELILTFQKATDINEITLMPYVDFPIQVVSILVYDNDEMNTPFELVSPTAIHKSHESREVISYQFQRVIGKKVVILLNQQHYVRKDIIANVNDKTLVDSWLYNQGIIDPPEEYMFKPLYHDLSLQNPQWSQVQKYLEKIDSVNGLEDYIDYSPDNIISTSKLEYQYGLYNIGVFSNEYADSGVYVTKPLTNQNIQRVELEATEEHPKMENIDTDVTSIEYYVTDRDEPTDKDWYPILPKNISEIKSERLHVEFDGTRYVSEMRFSLEKIIDVRGNGIRMMAHIDFEIVGNKVILLTYNPSFIYTISYIPSAKAYYVDFLEKITKRTFDAKNNEYIDTVNAHKKTEHIPLTSPTNKVALSKTPFWDRTQVNLLERKKLDWNPSYIGGYYMPIEIQLKLPTGETIMQLVDEFDTETTFLENRTDYHNITYNLIEPFSGSNYQYRVDRNEIIFNTVLPKGTEVIVHYRYITGPIRMKVIMRRNIKDELGLTPVLHDYRIALQSLL